MRRICYTLFKESSQKRDGRVILGLRSGRL
jgi:hypothetical protein